MVIDTMKHVKQRKLEIRNRLVWIYAVGGAFFHLLGAGLWGFVHTLPQINYYTHGSQVTVSHGHLAFFGAYAMLNLMVFYYAMPQLKGLEEHSEGRGKFGFWTMISAMFCLGLAFGVAGIIQAYLERVLGFGYMATQEQMRLWFTIAFFCGLGFLVGVLVTVYDLFFPKPVTRAAKA
jgi:nitric oxide reductase subunit B